MKRITKIYVPHDVHKDKTYHATFQPGKDQEKPHSQTGRLNSQFVMHLNDYEKLGKPSRIRVTITVLDNE